MMLYKKQASGFSLVSVMLALAIGGMLFSALGSHLLSLAEQLKGFEKDFKSDSPPTSACNPNPEDSEESLKFLKEKFLEVLEDRSNPSSPRKLKRITLEVPYKTESVDQHGDIGDWMIYVAYRDHKSPLSISGGGIDYVDVSPSSLVGNAYDITNKKIEIRKKICNKMRTFDSDNFRCTREGFIELCSINHKLSYDKCRSYQP